MMSGGRTVVNRCDETQKSANCQLTEDFILDCSRPQSASSATGLDTPVPSPSPTSYAEMTQVSMQPAWSLYQPLTPQMTPENQMANFSSIGPEQMTQTGRQSDPRPVGRPRGPKFVWTKEQRVYLEECYSLNHFSNGSVCEFFQQKWDIPPQKVKCWFQNRRSKDRKKLKAEKAAAMAEQGRDASSPLEMLPSVETTVPKRKRSSVKKLPPQYPYFPTPFPPPYDQSVLHNLGTQNPVQFSVAPYYANYPPLMSRISKGYCGSTYVDSLYPYQPSTGMSDSSIFQTNVSCASNVQNPGNVCCGVAETSSSTFMPTTYPRAEYNPKASVTNCTGDDMMNMMNLPQVNQSKKTVSYAAAYKGQQAPPPKNEDVFRCLYSEKELSAEGAYGRNVNSGQLRGDVMNQSAVHPFSFVPISCESTKTQSGIVQSENSALPVAENLSVKQRNPVSADAATDSPTASTDVPSTSTSPEPSSSASNYSVSSCASDTCNAAPPTPENVSGVDSRSLSDGVETSSACELPTSMGSGRDSSAGVMYCSGNSSLPWNVNQSLASYTSKVDTGAIGPMTFSTFGYMPYSDHGVAVNPVPAHTKIRMPFPSSVMPSGDVLYSGQQEMQPIDDNNNMVPSQADAAKMLMMNFMKYTPPMMITDESTASGYNEAVHGQELSPQSSHEEEYDETEEVDEVH